MAQPTAQKRPWLAALLAAFITGFGHLYLRRLRRAIGWLAVSFLVSALFVDPAAVEAIAAGSVDLETMMAVWPMYLVIGLSTLDAYLLAWIQNAIPSTPADDDSTACPHCGNDLDPDLEFCHWCTRSIEDGDRERLEESTDR